MRKPTPGFSIPLILIAVVLAGFVPETGASAGDGKGKHPSPSVKVTPPSANVEIENKQQFRAVVRGLTDKRVAWSIENNDKGSDLGSINQKGLYTAPAAAEEPFEITIRATSLANGAVSHTARVRIYPHPPAIEAVHPSVVSPGPVHLTVEGHGYYPGCVVYLSGRELPTTFVSSTTLAARADIRGPNGAKLAVRVVDPGPPRRGTRAVTIKVEKTPAEEVVIEPSSATIHAGEGLKFKAHLGDQEDVDFDWAVNGIPGGNETVGWINDGYYSAPGLPPVPNTVTISAVTTEAPSRSGQATVTILNPVPKLNAVFPLSLRPGPFLLEVRGQGFLENSQVLYNGDPLPTTFVSHTELQAAGTASRASGLKATVQVLNPDPGSASSRSVTVSILTDPDDTEYQTTLADAGRFLEQASFGPSEGSIDRVRELGLKSWLDEQFAAAESPYPEDGAKCEVRGVDDQFAWNMVHGEDQLRQRMVFALGQIFVVSGNKVGGREQLLPWQLMLSQQAFGNYRDLLEAVTLSPTMGRYLDLANSTKPSADGTSQPNENYPREVLQLFSIGLVKLNLDGTPQLDAFGEPIPTYDQEDIRNLALAMTGWGYPTGKCPIEPWPTRENYSGPMEPYEPAHDTTEKQLWDGIVIPAGGTARTDMTLALEAIFQHPNVGPFIATRLIRSLVTSNPSPEYVARVASVFNDNGKGVRGDFKAVLTAILLDKEARETAAGPDDGKLREPILYFTSVLRALDGQLNPERDFRGTASQDMGQKLLYPPSVFNYFSPLHRFGPDDLFAPEFQIYSPTAAVVRENLMFHIINETSCSEVEINLEPFFALVQQPEELVGLVDKTFFYGRMSPAMRQVLIDAVAGQTNHVRRRTMTAMYLALSSGEYLIQH